MSAKAATVYESPYTKQKKTSQPNRWCYTPRKNEITSFPTCSTHNAAGSFLKNIVVLGTCTYIKYENVKYEFPGRK